MRRLSLGLTQTKVANAINVTFQQIQKYEKGTNGVSSSRLLQVGCIFESTVVNYFYEDYDEIIKLIIQLENHTQENDRSKLLIEIIKNFFLN